MSAKALFHQIKEHKEKIEGPHFLFSAENPRFPEKNELKLDHSKVLSHLQGAGYDAHEVQGHYGAPERSIIVYGVSPEHGEKLHNLAARLGQDSSIYSSGQKHEMRFHHGEHAGRKIHGIGTVWHKERPLDYFTALPGGTHHFTHNFNFTPEEGLSKAENAEAYKKMAERGVMVAHPVTIGGQKERSDIGIPFHTTIKFFNPEKDKTDAIDGVARGLNMVPPDPKKTKITPGTLKDRFGNDIYVIKLHGEHADNIKEHNQKFSHMGYPANYVYQPHISVDKSTWDKIVASKATTAHEANINFGPAELRQGHTVLSTYKHVPQVNSKVVDTKEPEKMAASEDISKGFKEAIAGAAMLGAIGLASPQPAVPSDHMPHKAVYSSGQMLNAISQVESSGGKFANHRKLGGMHHGERAFGKYGLTPIVIRETVNMHKDLKSKHKKLMALQGNDLHRYMKDNPGLEDQIAARHLNRLEHHFGKNPAAIGYAWLQGISGTYGAKKHNEDINSHWHVQKIKRAYSGGT